MMKTLLCLCVLIAFAAIPAGAAITFDDLAGDSIAVPDGYGGLNWSNFKSVDGTTRHPLSGYYNGTVSPKNVIFNPWGDPAEFSGAPFNLGGLYLTAAWNTGLNVDIEGYLLGSPVYSRTVVVDTTAPTWVVLNYLNVDEVRFVSYGGTDHSPEDTGSGMHFVIDNVTLGELDPVVPAPAALALGAMGAGLVGWLRRRRTL